MCKKGSFTPEENAARAAFSSTSDTELATTSCEKHSRQNEHCQLKGFCLIEKRDFPRCYFEHYAL